MNNQEAAEKIREKLYRNDFQWPTDGCSKEQHKKYLHYKMKYYNGHTKEDLRKFIEKYVKKVLENETENDIITEQKTNQTELFKKD